MFGSKNMPQNKNPIQARIEEERSKSPVNDLTPKEIAQKVGNHARAEGVRANRDKISNTLKNSKTFKESLKNRDQTFRQDPEYKEIHKKRMQELHKDPLWIELHKKGLEELRNDPIRWAEYQKNYNQGNIAKLDNPKYWENYYKAIKLRDSNPEYHKKRLTASKEKIKQPVKTDLGIFETQTDAMKAHGFTNTEKVRHRCKSKNFPDWQFISQEEYHKFINK
jgi:hypothetical protein